MPSVAVTPLQLVLTGSEVGTVPARSTTAALVLTMTGGYVVAGPGTGISSSVTRPTLNRLHAKEQLTNADGTPTHRLMGIWQEAMDKIEEAFAGLSSQVTDLTVILARIEAAQALAQAANDNAVATRDAQDLADSYTDPTNVVTANNDGSLTIASHDRVYPVSGTRVTLNSGSVGGFTAGDYVTIYYQDAGREGGAVTYQATTNPVSQEGSTHIVGSGTIPDAGQPSTPGTSPSAPGYTPPQGGGTGGTNYQ